MGTSAGSGNGNTSTPGGSTAGSIPAGAPVTSTTTPGGTTSPTSGARGVPSANPETDAGPLTPGPSAATREQMANERAQGGSAMRVDIDPDNKPAWLQHAEAQEDAMRAARETQEQEAAARRTAREQARRPQGQPANTGSTSTSK